MFCFHVERTGFHAAILPPPAHPDAAVWCTFPHRGAEEVRGCWSCSHHLGMAGGGAGGGSGGDSDNSFYCDDLMRFTCINNTRFIRCYMNNLSVAIEDALVLVFGKKDKLVMFNLSKRWRRAVFGCPKRHLYAKERLHGISRLSSSFVVLEGKDFRKLELVLRRLKLSRGYSAFFRFNIDCIEHTRPQNCVHLTEVVGSGTIRPDTPLVSAGAEIRHRLTMSLHNLVFSNCSPVTPTRGGDGCADPQPPAAEAAPRSPRREPAWSTLPRRRCYIIGPGRRLLLRPCTATLIYAHR